MPSRVKHRHQHKWTASTFGMLGLFFVAMFMLFLQHRQAHRIGAVATAVGDVSSLGLVGKSTSTKTDSAVSKQLSTISNPQVEPPGGVIGGSASSHLLADLPEFAQQGKFKHVKKIPYDPNSIFVSIASYRDAQCQPTIRDMFEKAQRPGSIFVGAVEQHEKDDTVCMPPEFLAEECQTRSFCPSDNIHIRHIHPSNARGPTFGRYVGALMYAGQKYYMMIDSHNRFVTHWDAVVIGMYLRMQTQYKVPKPVLSHYPEAWWNPVDHPKQAAEAKPLDNRSTTTYTCTARFLKDLGYLRLDGMLLPRPKDNKPMPQAWAAAGFLFADASVIQECPFDPYLYYVFDGEEVMYSVRMWTNGWDIFSPSENILYHDYGRKNAPKYWQYVKQDKKRSAEKRIQRFLKAMHNQTNKRIVPDDDPDPIVHAEEDKYGLGKVRTLEQYYEYAGANKSNYSVAKKFCSYSAKN